MNENFGSDLFKLILKGAANKMGPDEFKKELNDLKKTITPAADTDSSKSEQAMENTEHTAKADDNNAKRAVKPDDKKESKPADKAVSNIVTGNPVEVRANASQNQQSPIIPLIKDMVKTDGQPQSVNFDPMSNKQVPSELENMKAATLWEQQNRDFLYKQVFVYAPAFVENWQMASGTQRMIWIRQWILQSQQAEQAKKTAAFAAVMATNPDRSHVCNDPNCECHHEQPVQASPAVAAAEQHPIVNMAAGDETINPLPGVSMDIGTYTEKQPKQAPGFVQKPVVATPVQFVNGFDNSELIKQYPVLGKIQDICNKMNQSIKFDAAVINNSFIGFIAAAVYGPSGEFSPNKSFTIDISGVTFDRRAKFYPVYWQPGTNVECYPAFRIFEDQRSGGPKDVFYPAAIEKYMAAGIGAVTDHPIYNDDWRTLNGAIDMSTIPTSKFFGESKEDRRAMKNGVNEKLQSMLDGGVLLMAMQAIPNGCRFRFDPNRFESDKSFVLTNQGVPQFVGGPITSDGHPIEIVVNPDGSVNLVSAMESRLILPDGSVSTSAKAVGDQPVKVNRSHKKKTPEEKKAVQESKEEKK